MSTRRAGSSSSPANTATPATIAMLSAIDLMIMTGNSVSTAIVSISVRPEKVIERPAV